ncbi:MAG: sensor histidine kinase [Acidimicrobiia bacterium]|nr:sensor histidine kinase [Acidimicrobiia bacterium]
MASLADLARTHTALSEPQLAHLQRLVRSWDLLADLSFADMLLFGRVRAHPDKFVILAQIRPTTGPTMYRRDRVGQVVSAGGRPLLTEAFRTGTVIDGGLLGRPEAERIRVLDIPVRLDGEVIAVLSRQFSPDAQRQPGDLEIAYFTVCRRIDRMVAEGVYPFPAEPDADVLPRVGDGVLLLDRQRRIRFVSPNARSTIVRLGIESELEDHQIDDLGLGIPNIAQGLETMTPGIDEIEVGADTVVVVRCLPLVANGHLTGGLVLVRDVSELRQRDRLLVTKDATIAEINHRVKNNLQTISSLLRLQGRRLAGPEAKQAIEESVRRIGSIAVVHEILSQEPGDAAPFGEILGPLVRMVEEGLVDPDHPISVVIDGDAGRLRSEQSTQLAVVLTELLQNAVAHAFPASARCDDARVHIELRNDGEVLRVGVVDNGVGTAADVMGEPTRLGLTIVETLVTSELRGTLTFSDAGGPPGRPGMRVSIDIPLSS